MHKVAIPVMIMAVGTLWLLNVLQVMPGVDWIWTGGLIIAGLLTILMGGRTQRTLVIGPFLIVAGIMSLLRQGGWISAEVEVPILVIALGTIMLLVGFTRYRETPGSEPEARGGPSTPRSTDHSAVP